MTDKPKHYIVTISTDASEITTKPLLDGSQIALYVEGAGTEQIEAFNASLDRLKGLDHNDIMVLSGTPMGKVVAFPAEKIREIRGGKAS